MNVRRKKFKRIRHFHQPGDFHELTFSCYQHLPLLTNDAWREMLAESIDRALIVHRMCLTAFVIMPEHVHLLIWPDDPTQANISGFLKSLKLSTSTKIRHRLVQQRSPLVEKLTIREREGIAVFRFWQEGPGYDRNIQSGAAVQSSIDYIHNNPLRRGLCRRPEQWVWSSYRHYLGDPKYPAPLKPRWTRLPAEYLSSK